jgi:hypothetical protein
MILKYLSRSPVGSATALIVALLSTGLASAQQSSGATTPTATQLQLSGRSQGGANVAVQQSATGSTSSSVNTLNPTVTVQGHLLANYGASD